MVSLCRTRTPKNAETVTGHTGRAERQTSRCFHGSILSSEIAATMLPSRLLLEDIHPFARALDTVA